MIEQYSPSCSSRSHSPYVNNAEKDNEDNSGTVVDRSDLVRAVLAHYESIPYGTVHVSEEEFVFDSLRNTLLFDILQVRQKG